MRVAYPERRLNVGPCVSWGCEGIRLGPREIPAPSPDEIERFVENIRRIQEKRDMAKMRAKLTVQTITQYQGGETLEFSAQYSNNKEDNSYADASPSALLKMTITNKALHGQFKPGQSFYVDFTPVE